MVWEPSSDVWPNITGNMRSFVYKTGETIVQRAFRVEGSGSFDIASTSWGVMVDANIGFDASRSSSIFTGTDVLQVPACQVLMIIKT